MRPITRGLAVAAPVSLLLWGMLALAALHTAESYRPGFRHDLKASVYRIAGMTDVW